MTDEEFAELEAKLAHDPYALSALRSIRALSGNDMPLPSFVKFPLVTWDNIKQAMGRFHRTPKKELIIFKEGVMPNIEQPTIEISPIYKGRYNCFDFYAHGELKTDLGYYQISCNVKLWEMPEGIYHCEWRNKPISIFIWKTDGMWKTCGLIVYNHDIAACEYACMHFNKKSNNL